MDIRVDGYRSTNEFWSYAHHLPSGELPPLNDQEQLVARKLGLSAEDYARSLVAVDLTREQLTDRAKVVGSLIQDWLVKHQLDFTVKAVWLKTFEGKYRIEVSSIGRPKLIFLDEDVIDHLLEGGRIEAEEQFDRALRLNLIGYAQAKAS